MKIGLIDFTKFYVIIIKFSYPLRRGPVIYQLKYVFLYVNIKEPHHYKTGKLCNISDIKVPRLCEINRCGFSAARKNSFDDFQLSLCITTGALPGF